ncbi:hypothetical protein ACFOY4_01450 [Actinomadura syzygii]|uniref:DUF2493 domain-containing protein n=2 Tax=Actinomadura syzygii TaxID=1427538 RepID=A0A5D0TRW7_9ACTN|nr:DUF2493 domain-containing protein [Actinomadura syzygii]
MYSHVILVTGARSWDDAPAMKRAFRDAWGAWGPSSVTRPLLVSGHCPPDEHGRGADAMAERLWQAQGLETRAVPADWSSHRRKAGFIRNQTMVDLVAGLRDQGSTVLCMAFLDLCQKSPNCPQQRDQQLMPHLGGHYSHGTVHCRAAAIERGIEPVDVLHPRLPPF